MRKALSAIFLASLLFRFWFALGYWMDKPLTHDAQEYLELAKNYLTSGQLKYDVHSTTEIESSGRAPGYPLYLAFLWSIEPNLSWIRLAETVVSLFSDSVAVQFTMG